MLQTSPVLKTPRLKLEDYNYLGRSIPLQDSEQKIRGEISYITDCGFVGMLHIRLVGSPTG